MGTSLESDPPSGTQAIRRAAAVLRSLGKAGAEGVTLAVVADDCGLARSTAHRILRCLIEERLASAPHERHFDQQMETIDGIQWRVSEAPVPYEEALAFM